MSTGLSFSQLSPLQWAVLAAAFATGLYQILAFLRAKQVERETERLLKDTKRQEQLQAEMAKVWVQREQALKEASERKKQEALERARAARTSEPKDDDDGYNPLMGPGQGSSYYRQKPKACRTG